MGMSSTGMKRIEGMERIGKVKTDGEEGKENKWPKWWIMKGVEGKRIKLVVRKNNHGG